MRLGLGGGAGLCKGRGVVYVIPALPKPFPIPAQLPVSHPEEYRPWKHVRFVCYNRVETPKEEVLKFSPYTPLALTEEGRG